jgi:hypothetical protein
MVVEKAFGRLKGRWRRLQMCDFEISRMPKVVKACCVLHNICEVNLIPFDQSLYYTEEDMQDINISEDVLTAVVKRNRLTNVANEEE